MVGMALIQEALTTLGLLGTGGFVGGWINEWRRSKREDRLRWHGERRTAYEDLLTSTHKLREASLELSMLVENLRAYTNWGDGPIFVEEDLLHQAEKVDDHWAEFCVAKVRSMRPTANDAEDQMNGAVSSIEIIADQSVKGLALALRDALYDLIQTAHNFPPRECGGWPPPLVEADERLEAARESFLEGTRKELGINS